MADSNTTSEKVGDSSKGEKAVASKGNSDIPKAEFVVKNVV